MRRLKTAFAWILALSLLISAGFVMPTVAEENAEVAGTINVYTRDSSSGTRSAFEEIVGFEGELTEDAFETSGNGDMATKIGADENGIGYVSLATDFEANSIVPVKYDGIEATIETVVDGEYKLARPFNFVTRAEDDYESDEIKQLVQAFVAFITESTEGKQVVLAAGGIVDVADSKPWDEIRADHPIVDQDNSGLTLITGGSTSVEKTLTAALEMFVPYAGNFQFNVSHTGSGDGYKRVLGNEKDSANASHIGFASRDFSDEEAVENGMASGTYCLDAVVVALNADAAQYDDLSNAQVKAIFTGEVKDFSEVPTIVAVVDETEVAEETEAVDEETEAAADETEAVEAGITTSDIEGEIHVYTRDSSSGTRSAFEEIVGFEGELTEDAFETSGNGDMATKVGADANAIGYVSLTTDFEANNLKALQYDGVEATVETVVNGDYKLARPFNLVTRAEDDYESDEIKQLVAAFVTFITESTEGRQAVLAAGGIVDVEGGTPWEELKVDHPIVDQDNSGLTLVTGGSTSVEKTLTAALETFVPLAGNFQFNVSHTGSGDGYKRVLGEEKDSANASHIGFASRDFSDEEAVEDGMMSATYCLDAVVVVVQADNGLENQTSEGVKNIFTAEVSEWTEVG